MDVFRILILEGELVMFSWANGIQVIFFSKKKKKRKETTLVIY